MPRNNLPPGVTKTTTKTGEPRYEVRVEVGNADGTRKQTKRRFTRLSDALDFYNGVATDRRRGIHVAPNTLTVRRAVDDWLAARRLKPKTHVSYVTALRPLVDALGETPVQQVTKADIEKVVTALLNGTSRTGTWNAPNKLKGKDIRDPWGSSAVNRTIRCARAVWADLMRQGTVLRNVPELVKSVPAKQSPMKTLTAAQVDTLLRVTRDDQYGAAWHLAAMGLRRAEIAALRWDSVDLTTGTLTVIENRVPVSGGSVTGTPKTETSQRTLPLPPDLAETLRRTRKRQLEDKLKASNQYVDSGYVVTDSLGTPPHPDTLTHYWGRALEKTKLPRVRLHDARHSCATLMHLRGVPIAVIAAWLGHADARFTMKTYAHSTTDTLTEAATVLGSLRPGERSNIRPS
jgi:integrase